MSLALITPIYNRAETFLPTLQSVLEQANQGIENYIVVSDGCEDVIQLRKLLKLKSNDFCKLIELSENSGTGAAINAGIRSTNSDWICTLDSDDVLAPNAIKNINLILSKFGQEIDFFYFNVINSLGVISPNPQPEEEITYASYLKHINLAIYQQHEKGLVARRLVYESINMPEKFAYEDLFHLEMNKRFSGRYFPIPIKICDVKQANRLSSTKPQINSNTDKLKIQGQARGFLNVIISQNLSLIIYSPAYFQVIFKKLIIRYIQILIYQILKLKKLIIDRFKN